MRFSLSMSFFLGGGGGGVGVARPIGFFLGGGGGGLSRKGLNISTFGKRARCMKLKKNA